MSTTHEPTTDLKEMLALLRSTPLGQLPIELVRPVEEAAYRLARQEDICWIPIADVYPLMGATFPGSMEYWVDHGLLRGRTEHDGSLSVRLDDILYRRAESEGLMAIGGDEMTEEELRILTKGRPGRNPWDREGEHPSAP
jgi:hypothetical protein